MYDDSEIPMETDEAVNFNTLNDSQKIATIARSRTLANNQATYLMHVFVNQNTTNFNPAYYNLLAECFRKLIRWLGNQVQRTRLLAKMKEFLSIEAVTEIHVAYLEACVETYNYRFGYQFVKSRQFFWMLSENKNVYSEYFYFAGLICQAEKDFEEALRFYKIASQLSNSHCNHKHEAAKMEMLLQFRLGENIRNQQCQHNQVIHDRLANVLSQNQQQDKDRSEFFNDKDLQQCLSDWQQEAILYEGLQKERQIHSKVPFDQIFTLMKGNQIGFKEYDFEVVDKLLAINQIHNMFYINEEKRYIEFKTNNLNYNDINQQLETRLELVEQLLNRK